MCCPRDPYTCHCPLVLLLCAFFFLFFFWLFNIVIKFDTTPSNPLHSIGWGHKKLTMGSLEWPNGQVTGLMYSFSWLFDLIETQRYGGTPIYAPDGREKLFNIPIHNYLYEWGKTIKAEHYFFYLIFYYYYYFVHFWTPFDALSWQWAIICVGIYLYYIFVVVLPNGSWSTKIIAELFKWLAFNLNEKEM